MKETGLNVFSNLCIYKFVNIICFTNAISPINEQNERQIDLHGMEVIEGKNMGPTSNVEIGLTVFLL